MYVSYKEVRSLQSLKENLPWGLDERLTEDTLGLLDNPQEFEKYIQGRMEKMLVRLQKGVVCQFESYGVPITEVALNYDESASILDDLLIPYVYTQGCLRGSLTDEESVSLLYTQFKELNPWNIIRISPVVTKRGFSIILYGGKIIDHVWEYSVPTKRVEPILLLNGHSAGEVTKALREWLQGNRFVLSLGVEV